MCDNTEGDEILLDGKITVLELDLYMLCSHVERGRLKFAPEVKPIRPPQVNVLACNEQDNSLIKRLRELRMSQQLKRLRELASVLQTSESQ